MTKDRHNYYREARLQSARKLVTPEALEAAKVYVPLNNLPYPHTEEQTGALVKAWGRLSSVLGRVAFPTFEDLWLAALRMAEEQIEEEENAGR